MKVFFISQLTYCGPNIINHFFCDVSPLLNLGCTHSERAAFIDFVAALFVLLMPLSIVILSYTCIIFTVLHISSVQGCQKAFSICASHLIVVIVFYETSIFICVRPKTLPVQVQTKSCLLSMPWLFFSSIPSFTAWGTKKLRMLSKRSCLEKEFPHRNISEFNDRKEEII